MKRLLIITFVLITVALARATTELGPWTPTFKGIDYMVGTNTPGATNFPSLFVVYALRVDLADPDIKLFTTPRITNYAADVRETGGLTVNDFLRTNGLQAAVNANFFDPGTYYLPAGTPMVVSGLEISEGVEVSTQNSANYSSAVIFDVSNQATIIHTNWPATNITGIYTAVSGTYPLVVNGTNIGYEYLSDPDFVHQQNPRTAFGLSEDNRYLYLVAIDGRQSPYSDGAYDYETAGWMLLLGAYNAVNMDGGGSTTLVIEDSTGNPVMLNHSSAVANDPQGRQRTVGSHFGIFARPVPGFINDVVAVPDDTTATITWTTIAPSTTQVQYDITTNLSNSSLFQSAQVTNHSALLSGLTPGTGYYFTAVSTTDTTQYVSSVFFFATTNYVTTNQLFDVTNSWKYTTTNLDGVNWTAAGYDDSSWSGPGPGLLWADQRGSNPSVQPENTQMPADPGNNGFPYRTYYFRTHFAVTNASPGTSLLFSSYVDDGAVFYLNGAEIFRMRMDPPPASISNGTFATAFPCNGDATCPDEFSISGELMTNLVAGDNVLAVEVHNYNQSSHDITFGTSLIDTQPYSRIPNLNIAYTQGSVTLTWDRDGFTLQQADSPTGPWADAPGSIVNSPFTSTNLTGIQYFRLFKP